ncbi:FtsK/SpoIIIE domain-containing protein [Streptomyces sp. NPDC090022]|uniref:FtsK/SpoIIIE domain-containing protein n=1 Tax=Streptomyces sp. NPDC090022 TaxID=3365920 RepID=UPI0038202337
MLLGRDENGTPIVLNLAYPAHALIAGNTRSGKSITVNTLLAYASLTRDVRLIMIDPDLGAVAPWWRTACKVSDAIHPDEPTRSCAGSARRCSAGSCCSGPVAPTASPSSAPSCRCCSG